MILSTFQFSIVLYWHGRCAKEQADEQIFYVNILPLPQAGLNSGFRVWKVTFKTQLPMPSKILFGHISVKGFNAITANGLLHFALLFFAGDNTLPFSETVSQWSTHQVVIPQCQCEGRVASRTT